MEPQILRLYGELWTEVTEWLDLVSIYRLMMLGCKHLSSSLARYAKSIHLQNISPILEFDAILRTAQHLHSLESITVLSTKPHSMVRYPILLENFPPKLRSLNLSFNTAYDLFAGFNFALLTPNLKELKLSGQCDTPVSLGGFALLPSTLETLSLLPQLAQREHPAVIAKLPRSLTWLDLHVAWDAPDSNFDASIWPPLLTHLRLQGHSISLNIELLPRNLVSLDLESFPDLTTDFPRLSDGFVFPWRVFFPRLTRLFLPIRCKLNFSSLLLRSIVTSEACQIETVQNFISSQPSCPGLSGELETVPLATYPTFSRLSLPLLSWSSQPRDVGSQLQSVAPYIRNTDMSPFRSKVAHLQHAGATSYATMGAITAQNEKLPSTLTSLNAVSVYLATLPSSLRSLVCLNLRESDGSDPAMIGSDHFPNLATLDLHCSLSFGAISNLPDTLTDLCLWLHEPAEWDLIATRLFRLCRLTLSLKSPWTSSKPLKPIASASLTSFGVSAEQAIQWTSAPRYSEFFASPSPLPPSVTDISISGSPIDASIFAVLPRQLLHLNVRGLAWAPISSEISAPFLEGANLTPENLIKLLPPRLRSISIRVMEGEKAIDIYCFRFLPKTLVQFECSNNDFELGSHDPPYIKSILPPAVSTFVIGDHMSYSKLTERSPSKQQ